MKLNSSELGCHVVTGTILFVSPLLYTVWVLNRQVWEPLH